MPFVGIEDYSNNLKIKYLKNMIYFGISNTKKEKAHDDHLIM
jgi:hypothetical protein